MRVGVTVANNEEQIFDDYNDALDFIEDLMPEIESLNISTDDIRIEYYD
jgi:hypothetical protein